MQQGWGDDYGLRGPGGLPDTLPTRFAALIVIKLGHPYGELSRRGVKSGGYADPGVQALEICHLEIGSQGRAGHESKRVLSTRFSDPNNPHEQAARRRAQGGLRITRLCSCEVSLSMVWCQWRGAIRSSAPFFFLDQKGGGEKQIVSIFIPFGTRSPLRSPLCGFGLRLRFLPVALSLFVETAAFGLWRMRGRCGRFA